jgi:transposase
MATLQGAPSPRYVVADAKRYSEEHAANLKKLGFMTRVPGTLKLVTHVIAHARRGDTWHSLDETTRYQAIELCHYGMAQGTNIKAAQFSDAEVIAGYKGQAQAEGGFRFLTAPLFFVSSLFVKKPCRIQGLLMVMTLALLVYSVAQRRLRRELARQNKTIRDCSAVRLLSLKESAFSGFLGKE